MSQEQLVLIDFVRLFLRSAMLYALLPFGEGVLSHTRKIMMAVLTAVCFLNFAKPVGIEQGVIPLYLVFANDILFGVLLAIPMALVVSAASLVGEVFDSIRGQTVASVQNPMLDGQYSMSAILIQFLAWTLLLSSGALAESVVRISLENNLLLSNFEVMGAELLAFISRLLNIFLVTLIPVACICILVEVAHAVFQKFVFSLSGGTEAFALKCLITLGFYWRWMDAESLSFLLQSWGAGIDLFIQS